jgi:flagellar biosynthesis/type III secretory pathway chaperone
MEKIVLTQEEINDLKSIQEQNSQLIVSFGQIEIGIQNLDTQKLELIKQLQILKNKENELAKALQVKYGNGNINIETGEFTKVD